MDSVTSILTSSVSVALFTLSWAYMMWQWLVNNGFFTDLLF